MTLQETVAGLLVRIRSSVVLAGHLGVTSIRVGKESRFIKLRE